ncbi:LPS assembly lipoprotein LptE [Poseidonocella sp. HB161398]|uniref:LPS assembly lipoprotein LptE n=1 Tax=Poseidonocella sp. HB161398 TaxID=2320855 RepID=UPI0011085A14|nr:LPS assembly lipoprotein LptE [Poseidonocella sp. HB161398]
MARSPASPALRLTRRALLGGLAALAAGCGFTPVYAPGGSGAALDRAVIFDTPDTSNGFVLRQRLQDRLGPAERPRYQLSVTLETSTERVAVTRNQDTRRYNIVGKAQFVLKTLDGDVVASGSYDSFNSYSATGTTVATLAAERDAYRRLMVILADGILDRLFLTVPAGDTGGDRA